MKFPTIALAATAALAAVAAPAATNWLTVVDTKGGGHAIGNPAAKIKLTEFVSYTCKHCGDFAKQATSALDVYVATGKVQLDVRHVVRDPVDLTVAMLANCGPAAKFPRNHAALMLAQPKWLPVAEKATSAQQSRWYNGPGPARRRAIASDLKLYDIMAPRGYDRIALDKCLNDEAMAKRLADQSVADDKKWKVAGTPSFAIDGTMLSGTHAWSILQPQLDARL
ncbi:DsbA family protein [Tsuneonella amylolytica]|uniref:DsbA family protein n=1 Tax=Tsuneonella amylolytica TaxID=2338327 RepID=UPI0013C42C84|nr:thioredoxin domain-containing protein [Tsuneonella amylolytica]